MWYGDSLTMANFRICALFSCEIANVSPFSNSILRFSTVALFICSTKLFKENFSSPWYGPWNGVSFFRQPNPKGAMFCPMNRTMRSYRLMTKLRHWWSASDRTNAFVEYHSWFRHESISIQSMSCLWTIKGMKNVVKFTINSRKSLINSHCKQIFYRFMMKNIKFNWRWLKYLAMDFS